VRRQRFSRACSQAAQPDSRCGLGDARGGGAARALGSALAAAVEASHPACKHVDWAHQGAGQACGVATERQVAEDDVAQVVVHLNDLGMVAGIALSARPLSDRAYHADASSCHHAASKQPTAHPHVSDADGPKDQGAEQGAMPLVPNAAAAGAYVGGLRSTVCAAMVQLAAVSAADVLLDACCGAGNLLREAEDSVRSHSPAQRQCDGGPVSLAPPSQPLQPCICALGLDSDGAALNKAARAVRQALLIHGDFRRLPIREGAVDVLVADLPFGRQHCLPAAVAPRKARPTAEGIDAQGRLEGQARCMMDVFLDEAARVVRRGTGRLCLLTAQPDEVVCSSAALPTGAALAPREPCWLLLLRQPVQLGSLSGTEILVFRRTAVKS
jgi:hypothetical protein